jgi:hypothetical protein
MNILPLNNIVRGAIYWGMFGPGALPRATHIAPQGLPEGRFLLRFSNLAIHLFISFELSALNY